MSDFSLKILLIDIALLINLDWSIIGYIMAIASLYVLGFAFANPFYSSFWLRFGS